MKCEFELVKTKSIDLESQLAKWTERDQLGIVKENQLEQERSLYERRMAEMKQELDERD